MGQKITTVTCPYCGKTTTRKSNPDRRFCDRACYEASRKSVAGPTMTTEPCATCGKPVTAYVSQRVGKHVYCSHDCASKGRRTRFEILCRWCDQPFIVTPTEFKNGRRLCSMKCRVAEKEDARNRICKICGKPFRVKEASHTMRTCSRECGSELCKRGKFTPCDICGKQVWVMPCHFHDFRFCSMKCKGKAQSQERSGPNHPNWRGGTSREPYPFEWTDELRAQIRQRDGNKCAECGDVASLTVHHIDYESLIVLIRT